MTMSMKLSALSLVISAVLSNSALAAMDEWDYSQTPGKPWGTATLAQYAEWNEFAWTSTNTATKTFYDDTPDVDGVAVLAATGTPIITSTSNIYSWQENATSYGVTLPGTTGGYFDVYLRASTLGLPPSTVAYLNGDAATAVQTYYHQNGVQFGLVDAENEFYFKWSNVAGADLYTFTWKDLTAHTSLDQLAVATVLLPNTNPVTPVPEPESYALMLIGLGLMGFVAKRKTRNV